MTLALLCQFTAQHVSNVNTSIFRSLCHQVGLLLFKYQDDARSNTHKIPGNLVKYERKLNFLTDFSKNTQISNFVRTFSVGAELFHADRQTHKQMDGWIDRQT